MRDHAALARYLAARSGMPFALGSKANDCVSFGAGAVIVQGGEDPLRDLEWSSPSEALRMLRRMGGLEAAIDARLRAISPCRAMRGDIAMVTDARGRPALAVVEGAMLVGPGNIRIPRAAMLRAWSAI